MRRGRRLAALALCGTLLWTPQAAMAEDGLRSINVDARPIRQFQNGSERTTFGDLTFLGGLELNADDDAFGSFSGIDFDADGRLYAVSDRGQWFSGILEETDDGAPTALTDAWMAPLRDRAGKVTTSKSLSDAEALRIVTRNGRRALMVTFEQTHGIRTYPLPFDAAAAATAVPLPSFVRGLRYNSGLEGLAVAPSGPPFSGAAIAFAERSTDGAGNHRAFILDGPRRGAFAIGRTGDFDITDAVFVPGGDLILLERRFSYRSGLATRLRRIDGDLIRPDRIVDGAVLLEAGFASQIDNMEGMAVRVREDGATILTLISDDNHNILQRTLLLQFRLDPPSVPLPRPRPQAPPGQG